MPHQGMQPVQPTTLPSKKEMLHLTSASFGTTFCGEWGLHMRQSPFAETRYLQLPAARGGGVVRR